MDSCVRRGTMEWLSEANGALREFWADHGYGTAYHMSIQMIFSIKFLFGAQG